MTWKDSETMRICRAERSRGSRWTRYASPGNILRGPCSMNFVPLHMFASYTIPYPLRALTHFTAQDDDDEDDEEKDGDDDDEEDDEEEDDEEEDEEEEEEVRLACSKAISAECFNPMLLTDQEEFNDRGF